MPPDEVTEEGEPTPEEETPEEEEKRKRLGAQWRRIEAHDKHQEGKEGYTPTESPPEA
jgi:hypothetical protein